jgi:hypothetical protein
MAILALCGALCSFFMNQSAIAKCEQIDAIIRFLRYVRNQVECYSLPSNEILALCDSALLERCGFYNCFGEGSFEKLAYDCDIYDVECARIVREFLCGFGKSYREEQIKECERYIAELEERRDRLFAELPKKKKVNSVLCIASALCVGIMLA